MPWSSTTMGEKKVKKEKMGVNVMNARDCVVVVVVVFAGEVVLHRRERKRDNDGFRLGHHHHPQTGRSVQGHSPR